MGFQLVPKTVTLNDLERRNGRRHALSRRQLSFLFRIWQTVRFINFALVQDYISSR